MKPSQPRGFAKHEPCLLRPSSAVGHSEWALKGKARLVSSSVPTVHSAPKTSCFLTTKPSLTTALFPSLRLSLWQLGLLPLSPSAVPLNHHPLCYRSNPLLPPPCACPDCQRSIGLRPGTTSTCYAPPIVNSALNRLSKNIKKT